MKKTARAALGLLLASAPAAAGEELLPETRRIRSAYAALAAAPADPKAQDAYLNAFPEDYRAYADAFSGAIAPDDKAQAHIAPLERIGLRVPGEALRKLLLVGAGAQGEAAAGMLQAVALKLALAFPHVFAATLAGLRPVERQGAASFLTDGPDGPPEETLGLAARLGVAGHHAAASQLRREARLAEARIRATRRA